MLAKGSYDAFVMSGNRLDFFARIERTKFTKKKYLIAR